MAIFRKSTEEKEAHRGRDFRYLLKEETKRRQKEDAAAEAARANGDTKR
ncbi:hypothetical protein [Streptomyces sp. NPDC050564]